MSDSLLSYLAGHFDGEGTLFMLSSRDSLRPLPHVAVSGVYVPTLNLYRERFGGKVVSVKVYPDRTKNPRPLSRWVLNRAEDCRSFSEQVAHMCYEKHDQLIVLRDYMAEHQRYGNTRSKVLRAFAVQVKEQLIALKRVNFTLEDRHEFSASFSYLAGHFDGEGAILMQEGRNRTCPAMRISISAAYAPILHTYQEMFGGGVGYKRGNYSNKTMFCWQLTTRAECLFLLTSLLPFLQEKREQAEVAINFLSKSLAQHIKGTNQFTRDDSITALARYTMEKLRELKQPPITNLPLCSSV